MLAHENCSFSPRRMHKEAEGLGVFSGATEEGKASLPFSKY